MHNNTVCLDTNILIELSLHYYSNKKSKMPKRNQHRYMLIKHLMGLIENNEIEIIVLPMVLLETARVSSRNNFRTMEFLEEFKNVFKVITYKNDQIVDNYELINQLSRVYCKKSTVITKKNKVLEFEPVFGEKSNSDAIIMAQAATLNLPLITRDKHFLTNNRPTRIRNINNFFIKSSARPYDLKSYFYKVIGLTYDDLIKQEKPVFQESVSSCVKVY